MKIKYNFKITPKDKTTFDLVREFVFNGLEKKQIFDKLTLDFRKYYSKKYGLSHIGSFEVYKENEFVPRISLYEYGIYLNYNAYVLSGYKCLESLEQYRYKVLFHELAHLVSTYNLGQAEYEKYLNSRECLYDKIEENYVNAMAVRFMLERGIIEDRGGLINGVDGEEEWWQLVLYRR